jgi:hypothetical protein
MSRINWPLAGALVVMGALLIFLYSVKFAVAHDHDHPELDEWYATLMQPDAPNTSCCGKADAYWCDDYYARDAKAYCKITDDRDDGPLGRPHIPVGTEIEIPLNKLKFDRGNPTGHNIIFVNRSQYVFCFVQSSGS